MVYVPLKPFVPVMATFCVNFGGLVWAAAGPATSNISAQQDMAASAASRVIFISFPLGVGYGLREAAQASVQRRKPECQRTNLPMRCGVENLTVQRACTKQPRLWRVATSRACRLSRAAGG